MTMERDIRVLASAARRSLPRSIDGRRAILEMKGEGCRHWRQMEWIGFYLEHLFRKAVPGIETGPKFRNTPFDFRLSEVWDLKAHASNTKQKWVILNDAEATDACISRFGRVCYILVSGEAEFDSSGSFQEWHERAKGGESEYTRRRKARGARSRRRKSGFLPRRICFFSFDSPEALKAGAREGWVAPFQKGMRNAGGSPRRPKYKVRLEGLPPSVLRRVVELDR